MSALKAIQDRLEQSSGLSFRGHQGERMVAVIEATAREEGASLDALAARLAADRVLVDELVARLVVHESHFLRDRSQMDLIRSVLADLARTTSHRIRIWSAGCAGGEEAHTLALLGVEAGLGGRLRVLGTDVSAPAIERARAGRYSAWSLRSVPDDVAARWFHHHAGTMVVREDARSLVRFEVRNLLDPPGGRFDLVLCRNVLMYLTPDAVGQVRRNLAGALRPAGWLITGASDPPLHDGGLARVRTAHGLAYRARPVVQPPAHPDPGAEPAPVRGLTARPVERPPATRAGPPSTAPAAPPRARPARPADLLGRAASAVDEHPLDPEARILASLAHLSHGQAAEAVREARAAVYLDSSLAVGHLIMGRANAALGRPETAARAYRRAQRLPAPARSQAEWEARLRALFSEAEGPAADERGAAGPEAGHDA